MVWFVRLLIIHVCMGWLVHVHLFLVMLILIVFVLRVQHMVMVILIRFAMVVFAGRKLQRVLMMLNVVLHIHI